MLSEIKDPANKLILRTSITECRMMPQDGAGYGRSMNWHYRAVRYANKTEEKCEHMDQQNKDFVVDRVLITLSPIEDGLGRKIKFHVKCALCDKLFLLTSQKLTEKFIKFYGL